MCMSIWVYEEFKLSAFCIYMIANIAIHISVWMWADDISSECMPVRVYDSLRIYEY